MNSTWIPIRFWLDLLTVEPVGTGGSDQNPIRIRSEKFGHFTANLAGTLPNKIPVGFRLGPISTCGECKDLDDGTLVVQSKSLLDNCEALKRAYGVIFELFKKFGLTLEHNKSEVFHFDCSHSKDNHPVDLGYAPYTGVTPLKPKLYWRYLGFYFDCKLTFTEHVRYYSTKALSTVKAMKMLAAHCKGALHHLSTMQCSTALWITGAFCTSPTGGVEALAGLPPINLLLCRLSERADYWFATLTPTHPTMSEPEIFRTSGTLFESDTNVLALTETLLPMNLLSRPGVRLMDRFADHVHFDDCKISRGDADKELKQRTKHLNKLCDKISENIGTYYAGTDTTAESSTGAPDMSQAKSLPLMWNSMPFILQSSMRLHGHSVAVCEALQTWFTRKDGQSITFVYIRSQLQWDVHYKAHKYTTELKVTLGPRPATSFDSLHMQAALSRSTSWNVLFQDPEYRGRNFLQLKTVDRAIAQPRGKDNPWVHFAKMSSPQLYTRMCRCILNHVPIGSYYSQFNLNNGHTLCLCGCSWETRTHILTCKRTYHPPRTCELRQPTTLCYLHSFLEMNPKVFAFHLAPLAGAG
ncbi:hypothetical protein CVT25_013038 [Psilocybe cyanescens]|uniref:Reverse transcriptase domain-containing protein n=1 Tax=Psilocybe cyanescens TaxID=93625 RepID=A0A409XSF6_PSICY|nr:hypothetical protein CVT25_013038 [Psilocybe cyanescens]